MRNIPDIGVVCLPPSLPLGINVILRPYPGHLLFPGLPSISSFLLFLVSALSVSSSPTVSKREGGGRAFVSIRVYTTQRSNPREAR